MKIFWPDFSFKQHEKFQVAFFFSHYFSWSHFKTKKKAKEYLFQGQSFH